MNEVIYQLKTHNLYDPGNNTIITTKDKTINGVADSWNESGTNLYGNFKQFLLLKKANRHLKVSLSIGGWTWSTNFAAVAGDPACRKKFVESSIRLLGDLGLDGIGKVIF
jgi:chitinase